MNWSFRIARVSGIDIKVHATFFIIVVLFAAQFSRLGIGGMLFGAAMSLLLFLCVTLHELGHSVVAQRFGVTVRQIVLLPIGGVAMMPSIPRNPWQELWIALAGPVVNVVIAGGIALGVWTRVQLTGLRLGDLLALGSQQPSAGWLLYWLFQANVALVLFNMIPAFPLDGGRVLRALLAMRMPHARATQAAAVVGQVLAILLGMYGLLSGHVLMVIVAAFIFFGAGAEVVEGRAQAVLSGRRVGDAYNKRAVSLGADEPIGRVVEHLLTGYQPDFAVTHGPELIGVVTRADVLRALAQGTRNLTVRDVMAPGVLTVQRTDTLEQVRQAMADRGTRVAAVFDGPHFLGLVSGEDIDEAFTVLQFLEPGRSGPAGPPSSASAGTVRAADAVD